VQLVAEERVDLAQRQQRRRDEAVQDRVGGRDAHRARDLRRLGLRGRARRLDRDLHRLGMPASWVASSVAT
jgi:hypothetical protein